MAVRRKPLITVVEARPMTDTNFKSAAGIPPPKPKSSTKTTSSNLVKSKLKIFESLEWNVNRNYYRLNDAKEDNTSKKTPVPAARKLITSAKSEMSLDVNEFDDSTNATTQPNKQTYGMKNNFGSTDEISKFGAEIDSISFSEARSKFGGNWFADKEDLTPSALSSKLKSKITIIRPKSTFAGSSSSYNLTKSGTEFNSNLSQGQSLDHISSSTQAALKPCIPRKPTIIKPKPLGKSITLMDSIETATKERFGNFDSGLKNTSFPDLIQPEQPMTSSNDLIDIMHNDVPPSMNIKNIDLLAELDFGMTSPKQDLLTNIPNSSNDFFTPDDPWSCLGNEDCPSQFSAFPAFEEPKPIKSAPPPRPTVGPKIQNPRKQAASNSALFHNCEPQGARAVALYNYNSGHPEDIVFKAGDVIVLDGLVDETWFNGHKWDGKEQGTFPSNFVKVIQPLPEAAPGSYPNRDRPRCIARYNFEGMRKNGELIFNKGDLIFLTKKINDDWFEGQMDYTSEMGIFPISFVEVIQDLDESDKDNTRALKEVMALYDFSSDQDGDLNFRAGDTIEVLKEINKEWMEGRIANRSGMFPSNFVTNL